MSYQFGHYDQNGHVNIILKELFSFLDPYAELKYQRDLLIPNKKDSTTKIQDELLQGEVLMDTTEEEW